MPEIGKAMLPSPVHQYVELLASETCAVEEGHVMGSLLQMRQL